MARAATATINLNAIRHNYMLAKNVAPEKQALAMIKADAYGHGAIRVAKALADSVDGYGVACIEEAIELREAGITLPILLLEGFFTADELAQISNENFWCAIHSLEQIETLANSKITNPLTIWLKMDSGMHRLGVDPQAYIDAYQQLSKLPQVKDIVLMSHFASADEPDKDTTQQQITLFDSLCSQIDAPVSLANSAGLMAHDSARRDWQRPGIMLYGASPFTSRQTIADQLQPAMTLSSEIIAVHDLKPGDAVGYGGRWVCDKPTRVGTVAMGYADGYPRHAKDGTPVLVDGQRTKVIGRVSMDMLTVDLSELPQSSVGSYVELWGENLLASEVADYCDTIPYSLFTGITRRVHKKYLG